MQFAPFSNLLAYYVPIAVAVLMSTSAGPASAQSSGQELKAFLQAHPQVRLNSVAILNVSGSCPLSVDTISGGRPVRFVFNWDNITGVGFDGYQDAGVAVFGKIRTEQPDVSPGDRWNSRFSGLVGRPEGEEFLRLLRRVRDQCGGGHTDDSEWIG